MVKANYECEICHETYDEEKKAGECEAQGISPIVIPSGTVYTAQLSETEAPFIYVIGGERAPQRRTHNNTYFAALLNGWGDYCGETEVAAIKEGGINRDNFSLVQNPREELKKHRAYRSLLTLLDLGVEEGIRKVQADLAKKTFFG